MAVTSITSHQIRDFAILNEDIASSAAIDGSKIYADFGAQNLIVDTDTLFVDATNNRVGILTTSPTSTLSIGASSQFQVNSSGNLIKLNNVTYSWPSTQGGVSTVLTNNGSGTLTWTAAGAGTLTGTGTSGQVAYWTGTTSEAGSDNLFWDNSNSRLGIGTNTPGKTLDVNGAIRVNTNAGLYQGRFTSAQEATFTGGLSSSDGGVTWFNVDESQFLGWNGTQIVVLG